MKIYDLEKSYDHLPDYDEVQNCQNNHDCQSSSKTKSNETNGTVGTVQNINTSERSKSGGTDSMDVGHSLEEDIGRSPPDISDVCDDGIGIDAMDSQINTNENWMSSSSKTRRGGIDGDYEENNENKVDKLIGEFGPTINDLKQIQGTGVLPGNHALTPKPSLPAGNKYRGLVNNSMTCYLNSVIQTLFMTPEFRQSLYKFKESDDQNIDKTKSIPYNLQRLFLELQFSENIKAIETVKLTKSFGWSSSDRDMQNDVQELIRKLFEALENKLKVSEHADEKQKNIIQDLYQGTMIDYIKCKDCKYVSPKNDSFLDLNLTVKAFGAEKAFKSLEESLTDYLKAETIAGVNCSKCCEKRVVDKGFKIKELPYLLTIQLKRFDFDYMTMNRVKLSDRVEFKTFMDLSNFVVSIKGKPVPSRTTLERQKIIALANLQRGILQKFLYFLLRFIFLIILNFFYFIRLTLI